MRISFIDMELENYAGKPKYLSNIYFEINLHKKQTACSNQRFFGRIQEDVEDIDKLSLDEIKCHLTETNNDISKLSSDVIMKKRQREQLQFQLTQEKMKKTRVLSMMLELEQQREKLKANKFYHAQDFPPLDSYLENMVTENADETNCKENSLTSANPENDTGYENEKKMFTEAMLAYKNQANIKSTSPLLDDYLKYIPHDIEDMVEQGMSANTGGNLDSPIKSYSENNRRKRAEVINIECTDNQALKPTWKILEQAGKKYYIKCQFER